MGRSIPEAGEAIKGFDQTTTAQAESYHTGDNDVSDRTKGPWRLGPIHKDGSFAIHAPGASVLHAKPFSSSFKQAKANAEYIVRLENAEGQVIKALVAAINFIAEEYRTNQLEPQGEWLPPEARKIHAALVEAVIAIDPSGAALADKEPSS